MSHRLSDAFIRNVRARMLELGLSQKELAKRIKRSDGFVSIMLSGGRRPGLDSLELFGEALDLDPAELIREKKLAKTA